MTSPSWPVFGIFLVILFILAGGLLLAAFILSMINQQFREMAAKHLPESFLQLGGGSSHTGTPPL